MVVEVCYAWFLRACLVACFLFVRITAAITTTNIKRRNEQIHQSNKCLGHLHDAKTKSDIFYFFPSRKNQTAKRNRLLVTAPTRSSKDECSTGVQTIILGLQIFLDHRSLSSIGQKILMVLHPPPLTPFLIIEVPGLHKLWYVLLS